MEKSKGIQGTEVSALMAEATERTHKLLNYKIAKALGYQWVKTKMPFANPSHTVMFWPSAKDFLPHSEPEAVPEPDPSVFDLLGKVCTRIGTVNYCPAHPQDYANTGCSKFGVMYGKQVYDAILARWGAIREESFVHHGERVYMTSIPDLENRGCFLVQRESLLNTEHARALAFVALWEAEEKFKEEQVREAVDSLLEHPGDPRNDCVRPVLEAVVRESGTLPDLRETIRERVNLFLDHPEDPRNDAVREILKGLQGEVKDGA